MSGVGDICTTVIRFLSVMKGLSMEDVHTSF